MADDARPRPRRIANDVVVLGQQHDDLLHGVTVGEIMTRDLRTIPADASLAEARALMERWHIHHLLVEDRGCIVALLSDRDLLGKISPYAQTSSAQRRDDETLRRRVLRAASYHLLTIRHTASIQEAAAQLIEHEISSLPVIDEHDHVVGIVTTRDLLRGMLECVVPTVR